MRPALFLLLPLAVSSMTAAEQRWIKATSTNFEVYTTAGEKKAREAILYLEQVNSFFKTAIGAGRATKGRVKVIAFQSAREYKPYQVFEGRPAYAGGGPDADRIVMESISPDTFRIAVHEYVHILLKPVKNLPLWLNEGMAQVYETLRPLGKKIVVGDPVPGGVYSLTQGKWLDINTLCAVDYKSQYYTNDRSKVTIFYSESWLLTHMLFLGDEYYGKGFRELFLQTLSGKSPDEAFQKAFGKRTSEIYKDLQRYSRIGTFKLRIFDVTLLKSAEAPEIKPVTPFESGLLLASVLADLNKIDEAKRAYAKLAADNPGSPEIPEELAYLALRQGKLDEVREQFAKAAELGSKNPRMYYEYCAMLSQAGAGPERQIPLLRKAVELDPEFSDARLHLGYQLMSSSDFAGAIAEFSRMKKVEPDQAYQFFYAVAYASYRTGDTEGAKANARRAAEYASDPAEKASMQTLIAALEGPPRQQLRTAVREPQREIEPEKEAVKEPEPEPEAKAPKTLRSREEATPVERPKLPPRTSVQGTLDQIDCLGTTARLLLTVGGRQVRLLIDKPTAIEVRGANSGTFTLTCGPQSPRRTVLIEYEPKANTQLGTAGLVRVVEMK